MTVNYSLFFVLLDGLYMDFRFADKILFSVLKDQDGGKFLIFYPLIDYEYLIDCICDLKFQTHI